MRTKEIFKDVTTIEGLRQLMNPPPHYNTILNAINTGKLTASLLPTSGQGNGIWLVHIPTARNIWRKRFVAKELK